MPPIPKPADIPAKPDGRTPQTAAPDNHNGKTLPVSTPATTTADTSSITPAMQPRPGAAVGMPPAPTNALQQPIASAATRTSAPSTTDSGPAPPQPGAVPSIPTQTASTTTTSGESQPPRPQAEGMVTAQLPPQMNIPPPTASALQGRSTMTDASASAGQPGSSGPTILYMGKVGSAGTVMGRGAASDAGIITGSGEGSGSGAATGSETGAGTSTGINADASAAPATMTSTSSIQQTQYGRPAGYVQNPFAADLSPQQRAMNGDNSILPAPLANAVGGFMGSGSDNGTATTGETKGVWETVKEVASAAGTKVAAAEAEVWHRINKS